MTVSASRPRPRIAPPHILRQVVNQFVQGEDAEADFVVGCFRAALEEAGEGHGRRGPGGGWQLKVGEVGIGAGALVDHPRAAPTVRVTWK